MITAIVSFSFSLEKVYTVGMIITEKNDTVKCFVEDTEYINQRKVKYSLKENQKPDRSVNLDTVKRIHVKNRTYDKLFYHFENSQHQTVTTFKLFCLEKDGFVRIYYNLLEGSENAMTSSGPNGSGGFSHSYYTSKDKYTYFLKKGNSEIKQLRMINLKEDLLRIVGDCAEVKENIEDKEYKLKTQWKQVVEIYNNWYEKKNK